MDQFAHDITDAFAPRNERLVTKPERDQFAADVYRSFGPRQRGAVPAPVVRLDPFAGPLLPALKPTRRPFSLLFRVLG